MPVTKQYLTYTAECRYGVVSGRKGGACLLPGTRKGHYLAVSPALEDVKIWDPRTCTVVGELGGGSEEVCVLCIRPKGAAGSEEAVIATGLQNGAIKLWELPKQTMTITLSGHKSAVTCLKFNSTGTQLVSGSKDTHIVVWDLVAEAGVVRLQGHKGAVTDCQWLSDTNILVTSSKDSLVKFWDLDTQHCFHTIVSHHREVWSLQLVGGGVSSEGVASLPRLVTVSGDNKLRVFRLSQDAADMTTEEKVPMVSVEIGSVKMNGLDHLSVVKQDPLGRFLACLCQSQGVEVYKVQSSEEQEQILKKRRKKAAKKQAGQESEVAEVRLTVSDEFKLVCTIKGSGKHRWVDLLSSKDVLLVLLTLQNNTLELHTVSGSSSQQLYTIATPGHRADVRTVCFSSDNSCILSGSAREVKIWRRLTQQCISTMASRYALCSTFVPGNRFALIGTKSGHLQLFDVGSSQLLEEIEAHEGAVWGLSLTPDKRGVISGSADKTVKFWEFELTSPDERTPGGKRLTVCPTRTLKLSEDVLGVCPSPSGHLLAVALLDSTVKVFFTDTLKFFLSLYGHKLPVLSMDIASDGALLVSSSADKNLRIWGLDFGDCHKSIFGHEDSITSVRFLQGTHLVFSASKDGTIKCWDADNFQHIQTLKGHHSEVWCLAVSDDGDTLVSASHDFSLRLWQRTREPLVLSEQKELEREALMDQLSGTDSAETPVIPGEVSGEASLPFSSSKDRLTVVDRVLEGMTIWQQEQEDLAEHAQLCSAAGRKQLAEPKKHPILVAMGNIEGQRYVLNIVKGIKSSDLEDCLLVMPFDQVLQFLQLSQQWLEMGCEVELVCRCVCFLLRVHHPQLLSSPHLLQTLTSLAGHTHKQVSHVKDMYGFNLAGLQYLQRELEGRGTRLFQDAPTLVSRKRKRKYQS